MACTALAGVLIEPDTVSIDKPKRAVGAALGVAALFNMNFAVTAGADTVGSAANMLLMHNVVGIADNTAALLQINTGRAATKGGAVVAHHNVAGKFNLPGLVGVTGFVGL